MNNIHKDNSPKVWQDFKRPFVRDLAYALACPNIIKQWVNFCPLDALPQVHTHSPEFWDTQFASYQSRLKQLDTCSDYQQLTKFLLRRPSPYRLGFHFEGLIHFWLIDGFAKNCHPFEVLAHNIQLYRDKQTIGELDFIIRNHKTAEVEHWELAIKFFLGSPPYDYANWVGINSRDNLQYKMTHMQKKQFCSVWVDVDTGSSEPAKVEKVKIDKRMAVIKGRFFMPYALDNEECRYNQVNDDKVNRGNTSFVIPDWLEPNFPLHYWIDARQHSPDKLNQALRSIANQTANMEVSASKYNPQDLKVNLRRANYVEWFTKRNFYDNKSIPIADIDQLTPLKQGLYFVNDTPVVIFTGYLKPPRKG